MNPELAKFLASIQQRAFVGSGIGTAAGYVQTVLSAAKSAGFCRQFPGRTAGDFAALMKSASETFVYRPSGETIKSLTKTKAGRIETVGAPARKDAGLSEASIMDFENILTTKDEDRDGDILHPEGGKLDPKMPLLWQHIPTEPIGKMVQVIEQSSELIKTHCAIADTPLGNLSAKLVEFGALRISHGFKPTKYKAISDGDEHGGLIRGWEVEEWEGMEVSLVSVPANTGAVITAYQKNQKDFKHCPIAEAWAKSLWEERPAMVRSGFGGGWRKSAITVNVNLNTGTDDKNTAKRGQPAKTKADDDQPADDKPEGKADDKPKDDATDDKSGNMLADVAQRAADMAEDEGLSNEVRARCNVVAGILTDVGSAIGAAMEQIQTAAESQDLAGLSAAQQQLISNCGTRLQRAAAELASLLQSGEEMGDSAVDAVQAMAEAIGTTLAGIMPSGQSQDADEGGTGDWVQLEGESDDDKSDDEDESEDEDAEKEETDLEDEDAGDDSETEEKDDDDADGDDEREEVNESTDDVTGDATDRDDIPGDADDVDDDEPGEDKDEDEYDDEKEDSDLEEKEDSETEDKGAEENDDQDTPLPTPPGNGGKKPKSLDGLARKLTAAAICGDRTSPDDHKRLLSAVLDGSATVSPDIWEAYQMACEDELNSL